MISPIVLLFAGVLALVLGLLLDLNGIDSTLLATLGLFIALIALVWYIVLAIKRSP